MQTGVPAKVLYRRNADPECGEWSLLGIGMINLIRHHLIRAALCMWQHRRRRGENQTIFGLSSAFFCCRKEVDICGV